jgi:hypothetical protein
LKSVPSVAWSGCRQAFGVISVPSDRFLRPVASIPFSRSPEFQRASLTPALCGRFWHQQEASVPPEGLPQFSCGRRARAGLIGVMPEREIQKRRRSAMTTKNETTKEKQAPAFYIFDTVETDGQKESKRVGAAFKHGKGNGYNIIIDGKRYAAFPPKAKTAAATEGEGA